MIVNTALSSSNSQTRVLYHNSFYIINQTLTPPLIKFHLVVTMYLAAISKRL